MICYLFLVILVVWTVWACSDLAQDLPDNVFLASGFAVMILAALLPIVT